MTRRLPLGGRLGAGHFALVDDADGDAMAAHAWHIQGAGYAATCAKINGAWKTKTLHRLVLGLPTLAVRGCPSDGVVDHINGNKLDNRRANLRVCTTSVNNSNGRPMRTCASGVRGVHFDGVTGKWCASWMVGGKREWHRFATKGEAATCRSEFNTRAGLPNAQLVGHAALMVRAKVLMPHLDEGEQRQLRVAMLAGDSDNLYALVSAINLRVA